MGNSNLHRQNRNLDQQQRIRKMSLKREAVFFMVLYITKQAPWHEDYLACQYNIVTNMTIAG
jgi:hypothetical protein